MNFSTVFHATQAAFELQSKVLVVSRVIVVELLKFLASASYRERRERDAHTQRERERESERVKGREEGRAGVGARGKSSGYSFELQMAGTILCPRMKLFRETPLEVGSSLRVCPCVSVFLYVRPYSPLRIL